MKRLLLIIGTVVVVLLLLATAAGSFYMLSFSLSPEEERTDTARCWQLLYADHPETQPWVDSLKACQALRDTFVTMATGERHHAYYIRRDSSSRAAVVVHGWRDCAIDFLYLARVYHQELGYSVLLPDLHAHGLSQGDAIGMGWKERHDLMQWMQVAAQLMATDSLVVHGVSMGAATTMNVAGEPLPPTIKKVWFVEDCGYTSVWDEFAYELRQEFSLPSFPLMHTTSLLCRLRYGWSFAEASPLQQVARCPWPMLFIHGGSDSFVPTAMVYPLYEAKPQPKALWVAEGSEHARSYADHPQEYTRRLKSFLGI